MGLFRTTKSVISGLIVIIALIFLIGPSAWADPQPVKQPIRVIIPLSAGSAIDLVARLVFEDVGRRTNRIYVFENRPGASQTIGAADVARSLPDGQTILVAGSALSVVPSTMPNIGLHVESDLAPVAPLVSVPLVMVVSPAKKYKTLSDFVSYARANPGVVTYGSAGRGDSTQLAAERFRQAAKFDGLYVPFKGAPEVLTEILAGRLDFYFAPALTALPMIRSGQLQALSVASLKRAKTLPDVPTTTEAGFADSNYEYWIGCFVSAHTPSSIVDSIHDDITTALRSPSIKDRLNQLGAEVLSETPEEFGDQIKTEIKMNAILVKSVGLQN